MIKHMRLHGTAQQFATPGNVLLASDTSPITNGKRLDTLATRCKEYKSQGTVFAKWRAAIRIGKLPDGGYNVGPCSMEVNATQLAQCADMPPVWNHRTRFMIVETFERILARFEARVLFLELIVPTGHKVKERDVLSQHHHAANSAHLRRPESAFINSKSTTR
eukprot:jgi/Picre1/30466/NNA_005830.t1